MDKSLFLFIFFSIFISKSLLSQANNDILYFDDGHTKKGTIFIKGEKNENFIFHFLEESTKDTIIISPNHVNNFVITKNKSKKIFERKTNKDSTIVFFEKIYKYQKYALFKSIDSKNYFLESSNNNFEYIPQDINKRRQLYKARMPFIPKIINRKAFSKKEASLKNFVNYLSQPSYRFPSNYIGLRVSYSSFEANSITSDNAAISTFFPKITKFNFSFYSTEIYLNSIQDRKGRIATNLSLGFQVIDSKGILQDEPTNLGYSLKGYYGYTSLMLNYYLTKRKFFPYFISGVKLGLLLKENSLIIKANDIGNNKIQLDYHPSQFFHNFFWTPKIGIGIELPLKSQHFLFLESSLESTNDANNKKIFFLNFSIGLNLF